MLAAAMAAIMDVVRQCGILGGSIMSDTKYRVAIIGCGRLGQQYAEAYSDFPETEIVALAEHNPERRKAVGERFGVKALYPDAESLLRDVVPDVAAVVTPTKYYKDAVIACAEAGVKGVSCDKPIAGVLADADEMVRVCEERGVVFAGGNLQCAMSEVREAAQRIHSGALGEVEGVALHGWGIQISGGGCQHISVLRLFTGAEVDEVIAWARPQEALESGCDDGLTVNGRFQLSNGMDCPVYGTETPYRGIEVWTDRALVRWDWGLPKILEGYDATGGQGSRGPSVCGLPLEEALLSGHVDTVVPELDRDGKRSMDIGARPAPGAGGRGRCRAFRASWQRARQAAVGRQVTFAPPLSVPVAGWGRDRQAPAGRRSGGACLVGLVPGAGMIETDEIEARVAAALKAIGVPYEVIACDPDSADTADFCERYGYRLEDCGNTIAVASKTWRQEVLRLRGQGLRPVGR